MVLTTYPLSSFAVCADPNAGVRQAARERHQQKMFKYKSDSVKFWNRETRYVKQKSAILSLGESRARSDIMQMIERKRAAGLTAKETAAKTYAAKQHVPTGEGSRTAGRNTWLSYLAAKKQVDKGIEQAAGRGQAIALEGLKRNRTQMLSKAKEAIGPRPEYGSLVMMPGSDKGAQIMGAVSTGLSIAAMFAGSDIRMKEDIEQVGVSPDGHKIYEFNYIGKPTRYRGAMAQEVAKIDPMAVGIRQDGYLGVNYGKIDVNMEVV